MSDIYASLTPLPTFDEISEHRQRQVTDGYLFPLEATSLGMPEPIQAHVRRLNITERAVIDALPLNLRQTVFEGVKEYERLTKQNRANPNAGLGNTLEEIVTNNEKSMKAADAFCVAAFIRPKLVYTEDERQNDPYTWTIDKVAVEDRALMFMACMDADSQAAGLLKLFRPETRPDVSDVAPKSNTAATFQVVGDQSNPQGSGI
jgi:hypothetical protein